MSEVGATAFSALVVGEGAMPMQCAHMLRRAGHSVVGIVSPDAAVRAWAAKAGVPSLAPGDDLVAFAREHAYDYLFSVVNYALLPVELLQSARRMAINYHDGPLPRYAGVYATSWAMIQGEVEHGVTWHVMVAEVDAGDILKQAMVPIAESDTATSLNVRCYQAAIGAFGELVRELAEGRETRTPQDLSKRTYFGFKRRPPGAGVLDWSRPAVELDRIVRALTFGSYWNPLGLPKVILPCGVFAITSMARADASGAAPGTLVARTSDGVRVATATDDVVVNGLRTIDGALVSVDDALAGAPEGATLAVKPTTIASLHAIAERVALQERHWLARLTRLPRREAGGVHIADLAAWPDARIELPRAITRAQWASAVLGAVRDDAGRAIVGVATAELHAMLATAGPLADALFAAWVPLECESPATDVEAELSVLAKRQTFARDLLVRVPALRAEPSLLPASWCRLSLLLGGDADGAPRRALPGTGMLACVTDDGRAMTWFVDERVVSRDEAQRIRVAVERSARQVSAAL